MRSSDYTRNKTRVDSAYKVSGRSLIALEPLRIMFPERFLEHDLAVVEKVTYVLGFLAIITNDNQYAACTVTANFRVEPDRIGRVTVDGISYVELFFDVGSKVIASTDLVINDNLVHSIWTEHYGKGKIPWYFDEDDLAVMFTETRKYNGFAIGADAAVLEYIAASLCRDPADPTRYYRQRPQINEPNPPKPYIVPLRNVSLGATNLTAKLGGSYFDPSVTVVLANPSDRAERIETMLRQ